MPRRRRNRKKQSTSRAIKSLKKDVRDLKNAPEWKYKEVLESDENVNTTGTVICLNPIAQETTVASRNLRVGNAVQGRKLTIRGHFHNDHGTPEDTIVRVIICRSKDVSNASLPKTSILASTVYTNSHRNFDELYNIKVYWDHTFAMDDANHKLIPWKFTKKFNIKSIYDQAGGADTDIEMNGWYIFFISTTVGTDNCPLLNFTSRFYFTDS